MKLAFDVDGRGPAVLFLHSTVADRRMWRPQWRPLIDAGYRAIRVDFPGFGDTPAPTAPNNEADDVHRLLDHLGVDRVALVAASGGGQVAQEFAARWPRRVWALALLAAAPAYRREKSEALRAFAAREDELLEAGDAEAATGLNVDTWVGPEADAATREFVARMQRHAFDVQLAAPDVDRIEADYDLGAIDAPSLLVSGGHDLPDFAEVADHLHSIIAGSRRVRLGWAGHLMNLERPDEITALIGDFLAECSDARSA